MYIPPVTSTKNVFCLPACIIGFLFDFAFMKSLQPVWFLYTPDDETNEEGSGMRERTWG